MNMFSRAKVFVQLLPHGIKICMTEIDFEACLVSFTFYAIHTFSMLNLDLCQRHDGTKNQSQPCLLGL